MKVVLSSTESEAVSEAFGRAPVQQHLSVAFSAASADAEGAGDGRQDDDRSRGDSTSGTDTASDDDVKGHAPSARGVIDTADTSPVPAHSQATTIVSERAEGEEGGHNHETPAVAPEELTAPDTVNATVAAAAAAAKAARVGRHAKKKKAFLRKRRAPAASRDDDVHVTVMSRHAGNRRSGAAKRKQRRVEDRPSVPDAVAARCGPGSAISTCGDGDMCVVALVCACVLGMNGGCVAAAAAVMLLC